MSKLPLLTLTICILAALTFLNTTHIFRLARSSSSQTNDVDVDNVIELPVALPASALKFEASMRYGLDSDDEWRTIMPRGKGFVRLGPNTLPFEVSLYHSIHCLEHLRRTFVDSSCLNDDESAAWHTHHCLNYLRQAIICNADTTLEPSYVLELENGRKIPAASGIDIVHKCRDWELLRNVLEASYDRYSHEPFPASVL